MENNLRNIPVKEVDIILDMDWLVEGYATILLKERRDSLRNARERAYDFP